VREVALGELIDLRYGKALVEADREPGDVPVVGSGGVVGQHSVALTSGPSIVVGRKGSVGSVTWTEVGAWPIDTAYYVSVRSRDVDLRWMYWLLRHLDLQHLNKAAAIPGLNRGDVYRLLVGLPTLAEQGRIATILDTTASIRARRTAFLATIERTGSFLFERAFADAELPSIPVGALMSRLRNGVSPATAGTVHARVLTLAAITRGTFDSTATKDGLFATEPPKDKRVNSRDFLMCRGNGNRDLVGVGTFSPEDRDDLVFPDTVIAGRVDESVANLSYLSWAWKRAQVRQQIGALAQTTNGTFKVNQQSISTVKIPLASLSKQNRFAAEIASIETLHTRVERAVALDDELFASLQSRAFAGGL
jgi:type I restriction enzyme, S subunit